MQSTMAYAAPMNGYANVLNGNGEPPLKRARSSSNDGPNGAMDKTNTGASPQTPQPSNPRLYSCGKCAKSYARLDHLSRHVRMHTQGNAQEGLRSRLIDCLTPR